MENLAWKVWKIFIERCSVSYDNNSGQQCLWDFFYCWQNAIPYNLTQYTLMRHTSQRFYFIQWPTYFLFFLFQTFCLDSVPYVNHGNDNSNHQPLGVCHFAKSKLVMNNASVMSRSKIRSTHNFGQNISRLFSRFSTNSIITSQMELDSYH